MAATAIETAELGYYNKHGQLIWSEPRGLAAGYAWPQYSVDRGDLQMILLDAVKQRIGAANVFTGHHLVSFEQDGRGVTADSPTAAAANRSHRGPATCSSVATDCTSGDARRLHTKRGSARVERAHPMARRRRGRALSRRPHSRD